MKDDKLFVERYEPRLKRQSIGNVVLRVYEHTPGVVPDDPEHSTKIIYTPRDEVDGRMTDLYSVSGEGRGIAITSLVSARAQQMHLFLLDCALPVATANTLKLVKVLRAAKNSMAALSDSMLLKTQNSYHVAGFLPLYQWEWAEHMGRALLLRTSDGQQVADVRYVGHSLDRGYGSLRISDYMGKPTPDFVCDI
jgi:hypothetical protein